MKILCATDFTPGAHAALLFARTLAKRADASLDVLHVVEHLRSGSLTEGTYPPFREWEDHLARQAEEAFDAMPEVTAETRSVIRATSASVGIAVQASKVQADLVITGRRGGTAFTRMMLGSVADQIARHAPCSVAIVPTTWTLDANTAVLVGHDLDPASDPAMRTGASFAQWFGCPLTVAHVVPRWRHPGLLLSGEGSVFDAEPELKKRCRATLADAATRTSVSTVQSTFVTEGHPAHKLLELSRELDAGALVVGTGADLTLGGTTTKLMRLSPCILVVARAKSD